MAANGTSSCSSSGNLTSSSFQEQGIAAMTAMASTQSIPGDSGFLTVCFYGDGQTNYTSSVYTVIKCNQDVRDLTPLLKASSSCLSNCCTPIPPTSTKMGHKRMITNARNRHYIIQMKLQLSRACSHSKLPRQRIPFARRHLLLAYSMMTKMICKVIM